MKSFKTFKTSTEVHFDVNKKCLPECILESITKLNKICLLIIIKHFKRILVYNFEVATFVIILKYF